MKYSSHLYQDGKGKADKGKKERNYFSIYISKAKRTHGLRCRISFYQKVLQRFERCSLQPLCSREKKGFLLHFSYLSHYGSIPSQIKIFEAFATRFCSSAPTKSRSVTSLLQTSFTAVLGRFLCLEIKREQFRGM